MGSCARSVLLTPKNALRPCSTPATTLHPPRISDRIEPLLSRHSESGRSESGAARLGLLASRSPGLTRPASEPWRRADMLVLGCLGLGWAALWLLTIPVGDIPLNDDWVYALTVRSVLETGRYTLPSPVNANVFAQIYWGALFCLPFG